MRATWVTIVVVGFAGCSLELDDDDGDDGDDAVIDAAPVPCAIGVQYRMEHFDCGPPPPDPPPDPDPCWWNLYRDPNTAGQITWCYTDVCESFAYSCTGPTLTATGVNPSRMCTGSLLADSTVRWECGSDVGIYEPY
jgi:hypothetical protein